MWPQGDRRGKRGGNHLIERRDLDGGIGKRLKKKRGKKSRCPRDEVARVGKENAGKG